MPKKRTQKIYFGVAQEEAVLRYIEAETEYEKNKIFNEYLKTPLEIMVESIIRRYKLYRKDFEFEDLRTDTLSFLMTKLNKYDDSKNCRAYSYFGTICKNYLMGSIQKDAKEANRKISYEDISRSLEESDEYSYIIDPVEVDHKMIISQMVDDIAEFMSTEELTDNEIKLGYALIEIFSNYDQIFDVGEGNKFNKNLILLSIREMTSLTTKEIRVSMKKYKKMYGEVLTDFLNN